MSNTPETARIIRVFVSSPGDVQEEREEIKEVVERINRTDGRASSFRLELFRWEDDVTPQIGPQPQRVVDDQTPRHFGEAIHEKCGTISEERDATELALTRWAMAEGKPLLAICRGIQMLNVALGGSLYQDIAAQLPTAGRHDWYPGFPRNHLAHTAALVAGSRLATISGTTHLPINSLHHQSVKVVAPGLEVTALAADDVVEALEARDHPFAVGVQWHPEELAGDDPRAQRLFDALVAASSR